MQNNNLRLLREGKHEEGYMAYLDVNGGDKYKAIQSALLDMAESMSFAFIKRDVSALLFLYNKIRGERKKLSVELKWIITGFIGDYLYLFEENIKSNGILKDYKEDLLERTKKFLKDKENKYVRQKIKDEMGLKWRRIR